MEFRTLRADEIDVKVGSVSKTGYTLLLYKNARVDMAILDETVGAENWQRDHKEVKGNLYCGVGINCGCNEFENILDDYGNVVGKKITRPIIDRWVWKWDCGVESAYGDKEKGEASDSFKRAGFNWGIGRELYTSPFIFIECETTSDDGKHYKIKNIEDIKKSNLMRVKEIEYNEKREITKLVIVDNYGVQVFPKNKIENTKAIETKKEEPEEEIIGGAFVLTGGKYDGHTIQEVFDKDQNYCKWCAINSKSQNIRMQFIKCLTDNGVVVEEEV